MIESQTDTTQITPLIGIVDSNPRQLKKTTLIVKEAGYRIATASDGLAALNLVAERDPDLLILGDPLDKLSTQGLVTRMREFTSLPVIVLGYSDDEDYQAGILNGGADNYSVKGEVSDRELSARIGALLRRANMGPDQKQQAISTNGELAIDFGQHLVKLEDREIPLTPTEYEILALLARNMGKTVLQEDIGLEVWGSGLEYYTTFSDGEHMLRINVDRIRKKLGENFYNPHFIITQLGVGYMMPKVDELIEFQIGPIDYKYQTNKDQPYPISRSETEKAVVLADGQRLNVSGQIREVINIVRSLPEGMSVRTTSLMVALGISRSACRGRIQRTRIALGGSGYTIGNANSPGFGLEARYYWKKVG
ncbi:MAG: response regulator transcription factor [Patescibacteria group bacterium]